MGRGTGNPTRTRLGHAPLTEGTEAIAWGEEERQEEGRAPVETGRLLGEEPAEGTCLDGVTAQRGQKASLVLLNFLGGSLGEGLKAQKLRLGL